tara:strand:- start:392 stop:703 length:312 start_codon:yes stop_codon:yes gene_type:complete
MNKEEIKVRKMMEQTERMLKERMKEIDDTLVVNLESGLLGYRYDHRVTLSKQMTLDSYTDGVEDYFYVLDVVLNPRVFIEYDEKQVVSELIKEYQHKKEKYFK